MYLLWKLHKAGFPEECYTPKSALEYALKLDSGNALETAINVTLTAVHLQLRRDKMPEEEIGAAVKQLYKENELIQRCAQRLRCITHEAC